MLDQHQLSYFNRKLADEFGYFQASNQANFRLVWSEDELETRLSSFTEEGVELLTPRVIRVPKYRQWIHQKYVLEKLTPIPIAHEELTVDKTSYEPIWTFQDNKGNYIEPKYQAAKFICNLILGQVFNKDGKAKYVVTNEQEAEKRKKELDEIYESLYGNETKLGDALARDSAVGFGERRRSDDFNPADKLSKTLEN